MTDHDTTAAERLLREASTNPAPRPAFRPYTGHYYRAAGLEPWYGKALFVNGRLRCWYRPDPCNDGLYEVYDDHNLTHRELVEGEDAAQALCYEWLEEG